MEYLERLEDAAPAAELDQIERYVDRAITLTQGRVGHYYETKGRVLALRGEFEAARAAVAQAVELEPRTARDYLRRLGDEELVYSAEHKELEVFTYDEVPRLHMPQPYKRTIARWRERAHHLA
ncbi:hypothetical protein [Micromonospora auratinigra]|uniref:Tetratricopeptide repeat-containing protein n=1 Tax=Micromonospora auratinigra TaxID=261654 RepID=A0A1A8Z9S6_9ACTN|nr:hypothetical protein [Micromonospora auratinigra]SBT40717.1 hypothetical protein GA0070611_1356 [Micromonospora auratinigra]